MADVAGTDLVGTEVTQARHHGMPRRGLRRLLFAAQPILHQQHHPAIRQHRRQQRRQQMVMRGFQRHGHHLTTGHVAHVVVGLHPRQDEIAVPRIHHQSVLAHVLEIAVHEKMHIATRPAQTRAVEPAQRARAQDCIASRVWHGYTFLEGGAAGRSMTNLAPPTASASSSSVPP